MPGLSILELSSAQVYWREVFICGTDHLAIGAAVLRTIPFAESSRPKAVKLALDNLRGIERQLVDAEEKLRNKLKFLPLRDRSDDTFKLRRNLFSFVESQSQGILDNLVTDSDGVINSLAGPLKSKDTPADYYHVANALLYNVLSFRTAAFFLFDRPANEIRAAVCKQLASLIETKKQALVMAEKIGQNRVSAVDEELILIDELGPVWGTTFTITLDGRLAYTDTFSGPREVPRRSLNEVRKKARDMQKSLAQTNADHAAAEVSRQYDLPSATATRICR